MKKKKKSIGSVLTGLAVGISILAGWSCSNGDRYQKERPNVIVIMTDDQGYGDIAAHGNPVINTPNLDQLHSESVRFTDFHVDPFCAPTRAALMTGCYSHRVNSWHVILGRNRPLADQPMMANVFAQNGYRTGMFGKWHLGINYPFRPMDRGFQEWLGQVGGGTATSQDYWGNDRVNDVYTRNGENEQIDGWGCDVFFHKAIQFIRRNRDRPFFLYLPTYVPHVPVNIPDTAWVEPYKGKVDLETAYFFATITKTDQNIGRLRNCLDELGIDDNTILIFLTDNGGTAGRSTFNAGMNGGKGSVYEGGHRVPCFIHWPEGKLNQPRDITRLTAHFDLLPTLIDLCGLDAPEGVKFDGISLKPMLMNPEEEMPPRTLVVEQQIVPKPVKWRMNSVMTDRWRLVNGSELYEIKADPGQKNDVSEQYPDIVKQLREEYENYWESVSANDNDFAAPIVGTQHQIETNLGTYIAYADVYPAHDHYLVMEGHSSDFFWKINVARKGLYRFEVRRWPREADTAIRGSYRFEKEVDSWLTGNPVTGAWIHPYVPVTGGESLQQGKALPVSKVRLQVGDQEKTLDVDDTMKECVFTFELPGGLTDVEATMLDAEDKAIGSAYYVYVRPVENETS